MAIDLKRATELFKQQYGRRGNITNVKAGLNEIHIYVSKRSPGVNIPQPFMGYKTKVIFK